MPACVLVTKSGPKDQKHRYGHRKSHDHNTSANAKKQARHRQGAHDWKGWVKVNGSFKHGHKSCLRTSPNGSHAASVGCVLQEESANHVCIRRRTTSMFTVALKLCRLNCFHYQHDIARQRCGHILALQHTIPQNYRQHGGAGDRLTPPPCDTNFPPNNTLHTHTPAAQLQRHTQPTV